jgi:hypothetical protein
VMYEYIRSIFLLDKTKTLAVIKPLYDTTCHANNLLKKIKNYFQLKVPYWLSNP